MVDQNNILDEGFGASNPLLNLNVPQGLINVGDDNHLDNMANFSMLVNANNAITQKGDPIAGKLPLLSQDASQESLVIDNATKIKIPVGEPGAEKKATGYDMGAELRDNAKKNIQFDDLPATEVVRSAAKKTGVDPALLLSSAWTEGMNKAILKPDDIGSAYPAKDKSFEKFPVDGFYNYGLDTFGERYNSLKKYLPEGFDKRFKAYTATNENNQKVKTAAFDNNEAALIAKGAMIKQAQDQVGDYFKKKDVPLDDKTSQYFALAAYNGGFGNAKKMMDEYLASADKKDFIDKGLTTRQGVHKNISSRIKNMAIAAQLLQ